MLEPPRSCSTPCSRNSCTKRRWSLNSISTPGRRALPSPLLIFPIPANSTPGPSSISTTSAKPKTRSTFRLRAASMAPPWEAGPSMPGRLSKPEPTPSSAISTPFRRIWRSPAPRSRTTLNHIRKAKDAVDIPIIASLNGATLGGWAKYARQIEQAGADAIECNLYSIPTNMEISGSEIENNYADILREIKTSVQIPVAAKLSPFFSNMANMAKRLDQMGTDGLVLFNRFYQPDIELEELEIKPNVLLSTPQDLRLPLTL